MKSFAILFTLLSLCAFCFGQAAPKETLKKNKKVVKPISVAPVTQLEARTVFIRVQKSIAAVTKLKQPYTVSIGTANTPVTREAVLAEYGRLSAWLKPSFSHTPAKPGRFDPAAIKVKPEAVAVAADLLRMGFLDRSGPLVTNPDSNVAPYAFGDSVGYFLARAAELTHIPSTHFSPYLNGGNPDSR